MYKTESNTVKILFVFADTHIGHHSKTKYIYQEYKCTKKDNSFFRFVLLNGITFFL